MDLMNAAALTIQQEVEQAAWQAIEQSQPGLARAITDLLTVGQSPQQIAVHVARATPSPLLCYSIESAALWRQRQLMTPPSQ